MLSKTLLLLFSLLGFASASLTAFDPSSGGADAAGSKNSRIGGRGLSSSQEKEFRKLMEGAAFDGRSVLETCGATLDLFDLLECTSTTIWYGSCGGLSDKIDGKWCTLYAEDGSSEDICCGESTSDCCEITGGGIAVFTIVGLVILFLIILCSCACCTCCPWHDKLCCKNCGGKRPEDDFPATAQVITATPEATGAKTY